MDSRVEYHAVDRLFLAGIPHIMGTSMEFASVGAEENVIRPLWDRFLIVLAGLDAKLDRFKSSSEVSRVNRREKVPDEEMQMLIDICLGYKEKTGGLFDISGKEGLDFGGFAKGYALKILKEMLVEAGIGTAFADFGKSSMLAMGHHPCAESWKVALTNPFDGSRIKIIDLKDCALSTSGNSPGYEGHIVNPLTGEPCTDSKMAVVMAQDPLDAEILSTALMIVDTEHLAIIKKNFPDAVMETEQL